MFRLIGTILFGVGSSLNGKVVVDRIVMGKKKKEHQRMLIIGTVFMLLGEGLRAIERDNPEAEVNYES